MPTLVEPLAGGHERLWKARLANGRELLAERAEGIDEESVGRLADLDSPHLARLVGAARKDGATWLLYATDGAVPLSSLLSRYSFDPGQATAALLGVLAGLVELHRSGRSHGAVAAEHVLVGPDGGVRLAALGGAAGSPAADLRAAGALACSLLGIPARPGERLHRAESWTPALAAEARALASGRMEGDAALALALIHDSAGRLSAPEQLERSRRHLAGMLRQMDGPVAAAVERVVPLPRRRRPPAAVPPPALPAAAVSPAPAPAPAAAPLPRQPEQRPAAIVPARRDQHPAWSTAAHRPPDRRRWGPAVGVLAAGLILVLLSLLWLAGFAHRPSYAPQAAAKPAPAHSSAAPAAAPAKPAPPAQPAIPPSAGDVRAVKLTPQGTCAPGASCSVRVDVNLNPLPAAASVAWVFDVRDACTGTTTQVPGASVQAQRGWNLVYGIGSLSLPQGRSLVVTAVTTSPAEAASPPLTLGSC